MRTLQLGNDNKEVPILLLLLAATFSEFNTVCSSGCLSCSVRLTVLWLLK